jgi:hypothetical protein
MHVQRISVRTWKEIMADWIAGLRMSSCCRILLFNVILNRIK